MGAVYVCLSEYAFAQMRKFIQNATYYLELTDKFGCF